MEEISLTAFKSVLLCKEHKLQVNIVLIKFMITVKQILITIKKSPKKKILMKIIRILKKKMTPRVLTTLNKKIKSLVAQAKQKDKAQNSSLKKFPYTKEKFRIMKN